MWNWFNCRVSGRHEYGVWCEPGAIFLRCVHCSRRSSGWLVDARDQPQVCERSASVADAISVAARHEFAVARNSATIGSHAPDGPVQCPPAASARILPFVRTHHDHPEQPDLRQAG
jgi:hypothetical protein